jgi:hypothetical protein
MIFDSLIAITVKSSQILLDWMEKDKFYPSPIFFEPQRLYISSDALLVSPLGPPKPQPLARTCRGGAGSPARLRFVVPQEQQPAPPEPQLASETLRCRSRRLPRMGLARSCSPWIRLATGAIAAFRRRSCNARLACAASLRCSRSPSTTPIASWTCGQRLAFLKAQIGWLARWNRCFSLQFCKCTTAQFRCKKFL